jgi:hypothetical protein
VKIPVSEHTGFPTVSPNSLRKYGTAGFDLADQEDAQGCPRQWKARYVDRLVDDDTEILAYGRIIHRALEIMEEDALGPEDALAKAWAESPLDLSPEYYAESLVDLRNYLARASSPLDRYGTLFTERRLTALLYEDEDFGPTYLQGIVDRAAVDFDDPALIHLVDFKSNRHPPSVEQVRRAVQPKAYTWLAYQNAAALFPHTTAPRIVFHLDAIKWWELPPVVFDDDDLEAWHSWTVAIVRKIWRDEDALPVLNPGCSYCPVQDDCPPYQKLPDLASYLMSVKPDDADDLVLWRDRANAARLLLEKAVKQVDARFVADAERLGLVEAGGYRWTRDVKWVDDTDARTLHDILGDDLFYALVTVGKGRLESTVKALDSTTARRALDCVRRVPDGTTIKKTGV